MSRSQLQSLLDDLAFWEGRGTTSWSRPRRLHHRAVQVHPFPNGNGRWARMLANIWLKRHGQPITKWPEETIGGKSAIREEYIAAIRAADEGETMSPSGPPRALTPGP